VREHNPRYEVVSSLPPTKHRVVCSCRRWSSPIEPTRQQAEDHFFKHVRLVEQARAGLSPRAATPQALKAQRDYAREQAENPEWGPRDQALWRQLADEISLRIGDGTPKWEDVEIPFG
jgi:hypothetical protein